MESAEPASWRGYSEQERDRRWGAVRAAAAADGLDCILVPLVLDSRSYRPRVDEPSATGANGRYLTQLDGAVVVLPTSETVAPIVITERSARNSWLAETRTSGRGWLDPTIQALRDTGMERATIGVVGPTAGTYTHANAADGVIVHSAFADLLARLPDATFRDATDIVGRARYVKSDEEIAALGRASAIAAAGLETLIQEARPGLAEATLYARIMRTLLAAGSAYVPLVLAAGPPDRPRYRHVNPQLGHTLEAGWLIEADVRSAWGGIVACESQTVVLGEISSSYAELASRQEDAFAAILGAMVPGCPVADVFRALLTNALGGGARTELELSGCGYGDDGPRLHSTHPLGEASNLRLEPGTAWTCRLRTGDTDGARSLYWGTTLVVTEAGIQRPAARTPTLQSI